MPRSPLDLDLQPCDAKALLDNEPAPVKTLLEGVDVQRGHGLVRTEDGRQAELATVAVEAWHIREHGEEELPEDSLGQLHEADAYVIRWKYSITTLGEDRQTGPSIQEINEMEFCFLVTFKTTNVKGIYSLSTSFFMLVQS